jgi:hypothetical protein
MALMANIKHAIRNNETVTIGGCEYTPDELRDAIDEIERLKENQS